MAIKQFALTGLSLLTAPWAFAGDSLVFSLEADAYSRPVSVHAFTHHWRDDLSSGDHAFAHARAEWSRRRGRDEFTLLWRYDYLLSFDEATARLYHAYEHAARPAVGVWPVGIRARHAEARGFRWSRDFAPHPHWTVSPAINLLQGLGLTEGMVQGQAALRTPGFDSKDFGAAALQVDYHYAEPALHEDDLGWRPARPEAWGYSLDFGTEWRPAPSLSLGLRARDLFGRLYWRDAPATRYDFAYQAAPAQRSLTGQLSVDERFVQSLPVRAEAWGRWRSGSGITTGAAIRANRLDATATLSLGQERWPGRPELMWEPGTGALGLVFSGPHYRLRWLADDPDAKQAHRLGVTLTAGLPW